MTRRVRVRFQRTDGGTRVIVGDRGTEAGSGDPAFRMLLQGKGRGGPAAGTEEAVDEALAPFDVSNLEIVEVLEGHGNGPGGASGSGAGGGTSGGSASVGLTVNEPTEIPMPETEIEEKYGQGIAGWTKPRYNIRVPFANPARVRIAVTLDFDIELAEEYTGMRGAVLRDHEQGHVTIGADEAQAHLVAGLDAALEAMGGFTPGGIQGALQSAAATFNAQEANASAQYDAADYPRMREAYIGAEATIEELATGSPAIGELAAALDDFASWDTLTMTPADVESIADDLEDAWGQLSEVDIARVQYNLGFVALVLLSWLAVGAIKLLHGATEADEEGEAESDGDMASALEGVTAVLDRFSWTPTV